MTSPQEDDRAKTRAHREELLAKTPLAQWSEHWHDPEWQRLDAGEVCGCETCMLGRALGTAAKNRGLRRLSIDIQNDPVGELVQDVAIARVTLAKIEEELEALDLEAGTLREWTMAIELGLARRRWPR